MTPDKSTVVVPAVVAPAPQAVAAPAVPAVVAAALSVIFTEPTWQSTKPGAAVRKADVQLLGLFSAMPHIALAGITIAQENKGRNSGSVIVYLPSASRVGAEKAVTARMVSGTQTVDGVTVPFMGVSALGTKQIAKLTDAIVDAWADANTGNRNPYGVELPLSL